MAWRGYGFSATLLERIDGGEVIGRASFYLRGLWESMVMPGTDFFDVQ